VIQTERRRRRRPETFTLDDDPLWYKDALVYELHVKAFMDSNEDGVGDFQGLIDKLPYLQDLGITAVWLLPFYPSPLRDDGYDIADYTDVNPMYGDLGDVHQLIREAHKRGLRVINELVCNHTSDQHPWYQRARRARPGSAAREFYVWSTTNQKYGDARIIFKDFEVSNWTWDHVANAYYWHRFYSHQPDLNFENPRVREAILKTCDFWLEAGIDGMRLDAVPYLFEKEGTNCENLPETHEFLRQLRKHIDDNYPNRMLLAEANQWPEDAVAYFGQNGDECNMNFHFPLMPRLFMSIRMEDRFPIVDILAQTPSIPDSAQWALFLRNHDELTLEMVTDEERDYMYRAYTQDRAARINLGIRRRLAPLLGNDRRRIELMNGLLFSLPGTPVLYYGDEIGMGDNIFLGDRNGVRTPMQWSGDRNAGFSRTNRQRLYLPVVTDPEYHYESVNVEAQSQNPHSLLSWMRRLIALRKRHRAFGRGTLELLRPENRKVLAFVRRYESEQIVCVANLSRFLQVVDLDLSQWRGMVPVELFSGNELPPVGETPYFLTLGPHSFYWFSMQPRVVPAISTDGGVAAAALPEIKVSGGWESVLFGSAKERLENVLVGYIKQRRWFAGKARRMKSVTIVDAIEVPGVDGNCFLATNFVAYAEGDPDTYLLPLAYAGPAEAGQIIERWPHAAVAWLRTPGADRGLLYDAVGPPGFADAILSIIARRRRAASSTGMLVGSTTRAFARLRGPEDLKLEAALSVAEQSNNSVVFGERLMLKVFRRLEEGVNPELEVGRFLTEKTEFDQIAPLAGSLEYRRDRGEPVTMAVLQGYVPNQGDAWQYTLNTLSHYLSAMALPASGEAPVLPHGVLQLSKTDLPEASTKAVGTYLDSARLLGKRTAELHIALASDPTDPAFAPERISPLDQRSIYQSMNQLATRSLELLRAQLNQIPEDARGDARKVLELEQKIWQSMRAFLTRRLNNTRIRVHGDYHLGQVLYTGHDFVIIDFEGEPTRSLYERRLKRLALRDVAGMLRSFDYASQAALRAQQFAPESQARVEGWARLWVDSVSAAFLRSYLATAGTASFVPQSPEDLELQLTTMLLEKALYELRYELNSRPDWVRIPLRGILEVVPQ
jgi:maltose alpha-D-glucosyltransferase/alpha-amylase